MANQFSFKIPTKRCLHSTILFSKIKPLPLFWKITHKDLPTPSYLLGTMHIQPKGNPNWKDAFLPYMEQCAGFATEFDLEEVDAQVIAEYSFLPNNQTLADYISPKKIKKLEKIFLKAAGLPIGGLLRTKPLFIANMLTEKILTEDHSVSMDSELYQLAKQLGKDCSGIETFAEQLEILQKIPIEYQVKNLLKIGKNISQFRKNLKKMFAIYEEGDVQKLHKVTRKGIGSIRKLMLYQRNELMAYRIFKKIQEKSIFCAIGAGHLGGKQGVLRLLKKRGLRVKPVF